LRKNEPAIHVVAGIKENEDIGSRDHGLERGSRSVCRIVHCRICRRNRSLGRIAYTARGLIAFSESRRLFHNAIFVNSKISGLEPGDVVSTFVSNGHIELDHVYDDVDVGTLLRRNALTAAKN